MVLKKSNNYNILNPIKRASHKTILQIEKFRSNFFPDPTNMTRVPEKCLNFRARFEPGKNYRSTKSNPLQKRRKKSHINLVCFIRTASYGPLSHKNEKTRVRNLRYGPRTRLIRLSYLKRVFLISVPAVFRFAYNIGVAYRLKCLAGRKSYEQEVANVG